MKMRAGDEAMGALIVTALLDARSQARFDAERARYFPAAINYLSAHVTLFHALPEEECQSVLLALGAACGGEAVMPFATRGLRFLGRGVAYELHMPAVVALRARLASAWGSWLTPQDRQGFRPHVTVQNKVTAAVARGLLEALRAGYAPWVGEVLGVAVWRYEGGPWGWVGEVRFGAE